MFEKVQKHMYLLVATSICVVFAIGYLFTGNIAGGSGMYGGLGNIVENVTPADVSLVNNSFTKLKVAAAQDAPVISYIGDAQVVGETVTFRDLFSLDGEGYIYLNDIKDENSISVLEIHTAESFEQMEEISSPFIYIKENDTLYFEKSGCFTVLVRVYGVNGADTLYQFTLPVEVGGGE